MPRALRFGRHRRRMNCDCAGYRPFPSLYTPPPALAGLRPYLIPLGFSHRRPLNSSGPLGASFAGIARCGRRSDNRRSVARLRRLRNARFLGQRAQSVGVGFRGCHRSGGDVARRARLLLARRQGVRSRLGSFGVGFARGSWLANLGALAKSYSELGLGAEAPAKRAKR